MNVMLMLINLPMDLSMSDYLRKCNQNSADEMIDVISNNSNNMNNNMELALGNNVNNVGNKLNNSGNTLNNSGNKLNNSGNTLNNNVMSNNVVALNN